MDFIPKEAYLKPTDSDEYCNNDHLILLNRRKALHLTQIQVASKACINLRQYQRVESGERQIISCSARIMLSICAVLKIDPYDFFPELRKS